MLRASRIEKLLRERELKFFRASDGEPRWLIPFQDGHLSIMLSEEGTNLLFRTSAIVVLEKLSLEVKAGWWQAAMAENDRMILGRWVGYDAIHFEVAFSLAGNARLTNTQFLLALGVSIGSLGNGRERLEETMAELPSTQLSIDALGIFSSRLKRSENN
ncbi:MAG: hypothetical protein SGI77_10910 [Pirellulaceae bacterium]|nr:hypothetical protein [Pirellulaceae bacterium]